MSIATLTLTLRQRRWRLLTTILVSPYQHPSPSISAATNYPPGSPGVSAQIYLMGRMGAAQSCSIHTTSCAPKQWEPASSQQLPGHTQCRRDRRCTSDYYNRDGQPGNIHVGKNSPFVYPSRRQPCPLLPDALYLDSIREHTAASYHPLTHPRRYCHLAGQDAQTSVYWFPREWKSSNYMKESRNLKSGIF